MKRRKPGKNFFDELSTIVAALRLQRKIFVGKELLTSCRPEYDLSADKYYLIVWREGTRTIEKISVETLKELSLSEEIIPPDCDALLKKFYTENVATVSFKVKNTRNVVERCLALFGSFDKKVHLQGDGHGYRAEKFSRKNYKTTCRDKKSVQIFSICNE